MGHSAFEILGGRSKGGKKKYIRELKGIQLSVLKSKKRTFFLAVASSSGLTTCSFSEAHPKASYHPQVWHVVSGNTLAVVPIKAEVSGKLAGDLCRCIENVNCLGCIFSSAVSLSDCFFLVPQLWV